MLINCIITELLIKFFLRLIKKLSKLKFYSIYANLKNYLKLHPSQKS